MGVPFCMTTDQDTTARLAAADHAFVWHPFTPMKQWREAPPIVIESGDGDYLIDTDGNRYIDGVSSLWCNVHGHRVPEIDDAIRDQLDRIAHSTMLGLASVPSIELAERLVGLLPCRDNQSPTLRKVFYSDAGATATELAFKMAIGFQYHTGHPERNVIVGFSGAYHGDTVGAMSVGYSETFHRPFKSLTFNTTFSPAPNVTHSPEARETTGWPWWDGDVRAAVRDRCLASFDTVLEANAGRIAAVCIEPLVQGAAGIVTHPEGFLAGVAERCAEHTIPLIADEVAVGFGRTGTMFACQQEDVVPDVICMAKGFSAGYLPLAATVCSDEIENAFCGEPHEHRTLYHGHTYTGNPLACAAALANLKRFETHRILNRVNFHAEIARRTIAERLMDHPHVGDVRQRGLMIGIELVQSREPWTPFEPSRRMGFNICMAARSEGLFIRPLGDTVVLMPMPGMETETIETMLRIVCDTIASFDFSN